MKNSLNGLLVTIITLLMTGCVSMRSSEGLAEGEFNVNAIAPFSGSVRYGIINNLEMRYMRVGDYHYYDLFLHTRNLSNSINYGLTLGVNTDNDSKLSGYYGGLTVSKRIDDYFIPYSSLILSGDENGIQNNMNFNSLAFGSDIIIPINNRRTINLLLTPEIRFTYPVRDYDMLGETYVYTSLNIGLIINVYSLFH